MWWCSADATGAAGAAGAASLLLLHKRHQIGGHLVADVQVDDPVHEVEADERDGEHDAGVFVHVG